MSIKENRLNISNKMKGRKFSEEHKKKLSLSHTGKKIHLDVVKKRSLKLKGKPRPDSVKEKISASNKGKKRTDETREKLRMIRQNYFESHPEQKTHLRKKTQQWLKLHPEFREEASERRSKQVFPYKDTKIEVQVQEILLKNKIQFLKHKNFKLSTSNHQVDILIEPNKVIEVNGDYWHFNPIIYDGNSLQKRRGKQLKAKEVWKKDKIIYDELNKLGFSVLVVWESELKNSKDISKKIMDFVKKISF